MLDPLGHASNADAGVAVGTIFGIYVHSSKNGSNTYTIPVKYNGFKEVSKLVALPDKPSVVALIDVDKGNQIDIVQQKHIRLNSTSLQNERFNFNH